MKRKGKRASITKIQMARATELLHTLEQIEEFLSTRDANSEFVKECAKSQYEFQRNEAKKMPSATVVELSLTDASRSDSPGEPEVLAYWFMARDVVENALRAYISKIKDELETLGVKI